MPGLNLPSGAWKRWRETLYSYGTIKLKFVANAQDVAKDLLNYINENSEDL